MCLILFSYAKDADTPLVVAANRDEFFSRPSAKAHYWEDYPDILAGRDLVANGTWLGITKTGRFAAVTNVREPDVVVDQPLSRGDLTSGFLASDMTPESYLLSLEENQHRYSGFNLLVGQFNPGNNELWYFSNRKEGRYELDSGTYGLSNHLLDSQWPKVADGKRFLSDANLSNNNNNHLLLRQFLENSSLADDEQLPATGVSYEKEKALSAAFITMPGYGTRTSTVLTLSNESIVFSEKNYLDETTGQQHKDTKVALFEIAR